MALEKIRPRVVDATGNYIFNDVTLTGNVSSPTANIGNVTGVNNLVASGSTITVTGSLSTTANITAGNIKTNNLLYANGSPWAIGTTTTVSGSNSQVQFNDASSFGASANFTFDKTSNTLTVTNLVTNGSGITNITGSSVTGQVPNAQIAATVYTNSQPNITSVGTLSSLSVTGNIVTGNADLGNTATANYFVGSGNNLSNIQGSSITGAVAYATTANSVSGSNVSGAVTYAATANAVAGANVLGQVANALVAATVYSNAQPNITSTGTLTGLNVTGNTALSGANVSLGAVANLHITGGTSGYVLQTDGSGTLSWIAQSGGGGVTTISNGNSNVNIPSSNGNINLSAVGNANVVVITGTGANINGYANISGNVTAGNISTSGSGGNITGANVITANTFTATVNIISNGVVNFTNTSNVALGAVGNVRITGGTVGQYLQTDGTGILSWATVSSGTGSNISNGNSNVNILSANGNVNISAVGNANVLVVTGTGANITGTLNVSGTATVGNISTSGSGGNITGANVVSANTFTASGNITAINANLGNAVIANYFTGNFYGTANLAVYATTANSVAGANVSGAVSYATTANAVAGANVSGQVGNALIAGTVYTNAQPNITSVGTLTDLIVSNSIVAGSGYGTVTTTQYSSIFAKANGLNATSLIQVKGNDGTAGMGMRALTGATSLIYSNAAIELKVGSTIRDLDVPTGGTTIATIASTGLTVTGDISGANLTLSGNLTVTGTTTTVNSTTTRVVDPIIEQGGGANGATLSSNDTKDRGTLLHYYTGGTATDAFMGWDNSNAEFAFGSNVSVTSDVVTFNNLANVRASYFIGDGAFLTSVTAITAGTVTTNAQPNITSVGTLTSLIVGNATANSTFGNGTITASGNISFTGANVSLGDASNLKITGGTSGYFLTTDGAGNLSWGAASGGGGVSATGSNTQIQFNDAGSLGASANLTFDKSTNTFATARIVASNGANLGNNVANIYIGGGSNNQILKTDGSGNLSWIAQPATTITVDNFTGDGTTTAFTLTTTPTSINQTAVNYNGTLQLRSAYTISGTTLTFTEAPDNAALIEVTTTMGVMSGAGAFVTRSYTGNGVQTTFSVTSGCTVSSVIVTENGLVQTPTVDYTISGSTLTFNGAPANGIIINIRELAIATAASTATAITVQDEGSNLTTTASLLNFVGAGVTATNGGNNVTVTIPSGGTSAAKAFGYSLVFGG